MELGPVRLSRSISSANTDAVSENLAPSSERTITPEPLSSDTATRAIFIPRVRDNEQHITQERNAAVVTVKDEAFHENQLLLHSELDKVPDWPREPARLSPLTVTRTFGLVWDIAVTLLPLLPITLAIASARLDNERISEWGERVIAATRLGPTIFPIIFAALVGRFAKSLARYLLEKGTTVTVGIYLQTACRSRGLILNSL